MSQILTIKSKEKLDLPSFKRGQKHNLYLHLSDNSLGRPWNVPLIIIRGKKKGPVLGVTAALHGDELNGISTIFKLIDQIDPEQLSGTLILAPICNVPGYLMQQRRYIDSVDLNRVMPGKEKGTPSAIYAHHLTSKIISKFDYHIDLHTAGQGRVNSLYIRADIENEGSRTLAYLQNPQIIVKKYDEQGTLRAWANDNNIPSITVEIGNPDAFQHNLIDETLEGILNTLRFYQMVPGEVKDMVTDAHICDHSFWYHSSKGGIVDVLPKLADKVTKGETIAIVYNVFGEIREEIIANRSGVVIGKTKSPNCDAGTKLLHLGVDQIEPDPEVIPANENFEDLSGA